MLFFLFLLFLFSFSFQDRRIQCCSKERTKQKDRNWEIEKNTEARLGFVQNICQQPIFQHDDIKHTEQRGIANGARVGIAREQTYAKKAFVIDAIAAKTPAQNHVAF